MQKNGGGFVFDNMENLKIMFSMKTEGKMHGKIECRKHHAFITRLTGCVRYDFSDRSFTVNAGEMIFIPKGSKYEYHITSAEPSTYTSINFEADFDETDVRAYSLDNFYGADYIKNSFTEQWKFGTPSDRYKCISVFYDLMSYVSNIEHINYSDSHKFHIIDPAVVYLKEHIYDTSLKAEMLHHLCGVSDTYFRKIFIARFRTNPQNYIISKRISHAKSIIDSGDFYNIKDVAYSVGYTDSLYFGKVFKKFYGVSPSDKMKGL